MKLAYDGTTGKAGRNQDGRIEQVAHKFLNSKDCECDLSWDKCKSLAGHYIEMSGRKFTAEELREYIKTTFGKEITGGLKDYLLRIALTGPTEYYFILTLKG
jgi:hypothetical protein